MEATAKGYEFAAENPDESAQILIDGDNTGSLKDAEDLVKKSRNSFPQNTLTTQKAGA